MMVRILTVLVISIVFLIGFIAVIPYMTSQNTYAIKEGNCPDINFLWAHIIDHRRFVEHKPACVILDGVINNDPNVSDEHDGDFKFDVTPDKGFEDLQNQHNAKGMVIEIVRWTKPDQSYIDKHGDYCKGIESQSHYPKLKYNDHVRITVKWVQDIRYPKPDHPQYNEIHPVEKIEIIS